MAVRPSQPDAMAQRILVREVARHETFADDGNRKRIERIRLRESAPCDDGYMQGLKVALANGRCNALWNLPGMAG